MKGNAWLGFFVISIIVIWILAKIGAASNRKKQRNQTATASAKLTEEGITDLSPGVNYLTGHPDIAAPVTGAIVGVRESVISIRQMLTDSSTNEIGAIPLVNVTNIASEDASTMEKKPTASQILTYGGAANAVAKEKKILRHYVTVSWKDGNFTHDTIFEFMGDQSIAQANTLRSNLIKRANAVQGATT